MKPLFILGAIVSLLLTMPSLSWAAANLNSSRSNIYRLVYDNTVVSPAQAAAILADLDKARLPYRGGGVIIRDIKVREIMKKHGVDVDRVKKIVILPPDATHKETTILLLANPEDEAQARNQIIGDDGHCYPTLPLDPSPPLEPIEECDETEIQIESQ